MTWLIWHILPFHIICVSEVVSLGVGLKVVQHNDLSREINCLLINTVQVVSCILPSITITLEKVKVNNFDFFFN